MHHILLCRTWESCMGCIRAWKHPLYSVQPSVGCARLSSANLSHQQERRILADNRSSHPVNSVVVRYNTREHGMENLPWNNPSFLETHRSPTYLTLTHDIYTVQGKSTFTIHTAKTPTDHPLSPTTSYVWRQIHTYDAKHSYEIIIALSSHWRFSFFFNVPQYIYIW